MPGMRLYRFSPVFDLLFLVVSLFHRTYYRRFIVIGRNNVPSGCPVIFAANHQNALMDALAVMFAARQPIVFLARADIFRNKFIARLLHFIKILPVYRVRDGWSSLGRNQDTFNEVFEILRHKKPVGLFPEGLHLGRKTLKPLRKGIARMAFQTEEKTGFTLGLKIVPVGLDYSDYFKPGSDLLVIFGKPIDLSVYKDLYADNPTAAILQLREDLAAAMREIMIDIPDDEHYNAALREAEQKASDLLKSRGLRNTIYNRFLIIKELCNEMSSRGTFRGTSSPPPSSTILNHASAILHISILLLLLPLAVYGAVMNILPALIASHISRKVRDPHLLVSVRFGAGFILFTLWYLLLTVFALLMLPSLWLSVLTILSLPLSGIFAFYYFRHARYLFRLN